MLLIFFILLVISNKCKINVMINNNIEKIKIFFSHGLHLIKTGKWIDRNVMLTNSNRFNFSDLFVQLFLKP